MEGTIGEIRMFAGNFAPRNWMFCNGQLLSISQYQALFSLLGTTYGGDGKNNFALPDLRGRVPIGPGTGPGLPAYYQGQAGGSPNNHLTVYELPAHTHTAQGTVKPNASTGGRGVTTSNSPENNFPSTSPEGTNIYAESANTQMGESEVTITVGNTGANQPVNNMQPFLGMYYIICVQGLYPSRN